MITPNQLRVGNVLMSNKDTRITITPSDIHRCSEFPIEKQKHPMTHSLFIRNLTDDSIHEVRKYIKDDQGTISIWTNSWYGRHVIGQDCEFVSQEDQMNLHSWLHVNQK